MLFEHFDLELEIELLFEKELFVGRLETSDVAIIKAPSLQTNRVQAAGRCWAAIHNHEWRHISDHTGKSCNHGMLADATELMHRTEARNDGMVTNRDVACDGGIIREDSVIPHLAFVSHVSVAEEKIVVADPGRRLGLGAAMNGHVLAEGVIIPDVEMGFFSGVFHVLRATTDSGERESLATLANRCVALDHDVTVQTRVISEGHVLSDHAVRTNFATGADLSCG